MKFRAAVVVFCALFLLLTCNVAVADSIVVSGSATANAENHSFRQTVAIGNELFFENESFDQRVESTVSIPLVYSLPSGFSLASALLEFSIAGAIDTNVSGTSLPLVGSENDFAPAALQAVTDNEGPLIMVSIGSESFVLMADVFTGSASADLIGMGYGDLLQQGAPISITATVTMFSFIEAGQSPWWGRNAISEVSIDQYWSGRFDAKLTLGTHPVPEPATLLLLSSGILGAAGWARRRARPRAEV